MLLFSTICPHPSLERSTKDRYQRQQELTQSRRRRLHHSNGHIHTNTSHNEQIEEMIGSRANPD
ncbi:MAG TPA: hypothetical protein ENJ13_00745 [Chromatiales bacterium]|nr:hypothetical protein [Chromatiales bacterium]